MFPQLCKRCRKKCFSRKTSERVSRLLHFISHCFNPYHHTSKQSNPPGFTAVPRKKLLSMLMLVTSAPHVNQELPAAGHQSRGSCYLFQVHKAAC